MRAIWAMGNISCFNSFCKAVCRENGCAFWESSSARSKGLGTISVSKTCAEMWNQTLFLCNALFNDWIVFWRAKWSDPQMASISILPLQLIQLLWTCQSIMLSWSHALSAECKFFSRGIQINSLPPFLFPLLSSVSSSVPSVILYFNSTFSVYKAAGVIQILYSSWNPLCRNLIIGFKFSILLTDYKCLSALLSTPSPMKGSSSHELNVFIKVP